jgi:protein-S-isoprenylcysteine O-methyltransferase Ste14
LYIWGRGHKVINFFISTLVKIAQKKHPQWYRFLTLIGTIAFVFVLLPLFYLYTGHYIEDLIQGTIITPSTYAFHKNAIPFLVGGGFFMIWALVFQYGYGKGSGSHMVAPQKLIVAGPYKICRHPMLFGAVFFYLGTGMLFGSVIIGCYGAITTAILAYFFARYIEEPVLIKRFGEQYKQYQKEVPFIPFSFTRFNDCNRKHKPHN